MQAAQHPGVKGSPCTALSCRERRAVMIGSETCGTIVLGLGRETPSYGYNDCLFC